MMMEISEKVAKSMGHARFGWHEDELLAECERLAAMLGGDAHLWISLDTKNHSTLGRAVVAIFYGVRASQLHKTYGDTFAEALAGAETWVAQYLASRPRVMVAGDLGL